MYLLDSNDPLNSPVDRGITGKLYGGGTEMRLLQEIVLGVGGWRLVEAVHPEIEICHLNEGHAAFAVLERARSLAAAARPRFRGGAVGDAAPATSSPRTRRWRPDSTAIPPSCSASIATPRWVRLPTVSPPPRWRSPGPNRAARLTWRTWRCVGHTPASASAALHGAVSRRIFQPLFPRWPEHEVPVGHVTNGVHVPTWDSPEADAVWTEACGKERWRRMAEPLHDAIAAVGDEVLWEMRGRSRQRLVAAVRARLRRQLIGRGQPPAVVALADSVLDPNILTLGFARRFTGYKRPNLLLARPRTAGAAA